MATTAETTRPTDERRSAGSFFDALVSLARRAGSGPFRFDVDLDVDKDDGLGLYLRRRGSEEEPQVFEATRGAEMFTMIEEAHEFLDEGSRDAGSAS